MRYVDICTGLSAATVAWHPLGWKPVCFAEIEPFPSAVLQHHYSDVPNVGDFTKIRGDEYGAVDALVGGTPCQDFSVAGLRAGMDGKRGQLTVEYAHLAHRLGSRWVVWENVPGVLSIDGGEAFATFLGLLCGYTVKVPAGGWQNSGVVAGAPGSYGLAYRVLDAQYAGVPQRRRRVFVVGYLGDWRCAAAVLFERHSLSGNPPPRREAGQVAPTIPSRSLGGGGLGTDFDCDGGLISSTIAPPLTGNPYGDNESREGLLIASTGDIAHCLNAGGMGRQDYETETVIVHSLRVDGFDASEDGTGRGTPLVPVAFRAAGQDGFTPSDICPPITSTDGGGAGVPTIAFDCKASGRNGFGVGDVSPTLRAMGKADSHANAGGQVAVMTLAIRGREGSPSLEVREDGIANAVLTPNGGRGGIGVGAVAIAENIRGEILESEVARCLQVGGSKPGQGYPAIRSGMAVRRLTPRECERLQGFPDDYTLIRYHRLLKSGKLSKRLYEAADGPRYKALGNSMAVPVMRWIGERIQMVDEVQRRAA